MIEIEKSKTVVIRKIGHIMFLIDTKKSYNSESEYLFQLDKIGKLIWDEIVENDSIDNLTNRIVMKFSEEKTDEFVLRVKTDIVEFLNLLEENKLIRRYENGV